MLHRLRKYFNDRKRRDRFKREWSEFRKSEVQTTPRFTMNDEDLFPCLHDDTAVTGFDRHYVYHVAWAMRVVKEINPDVHIDFSSSLHFCTALSAFIPVQFYDYRPAKLELEGLESLKGDLTKIAFADNSIHSLSCMHTVEHVGLGRYGDAIDYDGDLKAIAELKRVVKPGGSLLFVVPIGKARIQFNAHRIYSYEMVLNNFNGFGLREFTLIPEHERDGGLIRNATKSQADKEKYGCGCFWFIKK